MNDNARNIVTGILIHDEIQRRNEVSRQEQTAQAEQLREQNEKLENHSSKLKQDNKKLQNDVEDIEDDLVQANAQTVALVNHANKLQQQVNDYRALLCKPLLEIAEKNENFKEAYDKQMEIMADWMVSQKAFKELAIRFGIERGLKAEEVISMGIEAKNDVLQDNHDPGHKTNSSDSQLITKYKDKLIKKSQVKPINK